MAPSWPVSRRPAATSLDRVRGRRRHGPALAKRVKILASQKRIVYKPTNCFYQVLSAGVYSKHGTNISGVVFDEFHTQPNRARFDVMAKGSGDARTQPLYFLITTAGTDTHSVCYEQPQLALDILAGRKHDPRFYPVIYGANVNDDWTAEATWRKANPSLDITVPVAKVVETCASARQNPAGEYTFRQLRLNQWIKQEVRWMPMRIWNANNAPVAPTALEDQVCYVELDLSSTSDITAFVLVFPPERSDEPYQILPPPVAAGRHPHPTCRPGPGVLRPMGHTQGFLTTEGNVVYYEAIEHTIEQLGMRYNIREIAYARWSAVQMS